MPPAAEWRTVYVEARQPVVLVGRAFIVELQWGRVVREDDVASVHGYTGTL